MTTATPSSTRNLDRYGAPTIEWGRVQAVLDSGVTQGPDAGGPNRHTIWLATVRPDGRPHVVPVGALRVDGTFYFTAGPNTRKARNLAANASCVLTVATHDFDLVIEGRAARVTDPDTVARIAGAYAGNGWPAVAEGAEITAPYSAPSAGPPPWHLYVVTAERVFALGTAEPYGATRWEF